MYMLTESLFLKLLTLFDSALSVTDSTVFRLVRGANWRKHQALDCSIGPHQSLGPLRCKYIYE
ncbi:hypothetical protein AAHE18_01G264000 [Arachis hypogaea]